MPLVSLRHGTDATWDPLAGKVQAPRRAQPPKSYNPRFSASAAGKAPRGYQTQAYYGNSRLPGHGVSGFPTTGMSGDFGSQWRILSDSLVGRLDAGLAKFTAQNHDNRQNQNHFNQTSNEGPYRRGPFDDDGGVKPMEVFDTRLEQMRNFPKSLLDTHINDTAKGISRLDLGKELPLERESAFAVGPHGRHAEVHEPFPSVDWRRTSQWKPPVTGNSLAELESKTRPPVGTHYVFGRVGVAAAGTHPQQGGGAPAVFQTPGVRNEGTVFKWEELMRDIPAVHQPQETPVIHTNPEAEVRQQYADYGEGI